MENPPADTDSPSLRPIITSMASMDTPRDFRINANLDVAGLSPTTRKSCVLFYAPETEMLARKVAAENSNIKLAKCRWRKFADGFPVSNVQHV